MEGLKMKQYLLPPAGENLHYYRANLHCHSTISDGSKTPEQLKADYKAHGYQILCLTDHELYLTHNDMTEPDFLMLNGVELGVDSKTADKTCHLCYVALDKENDKAVCWHRSKYLWGNAAKLRDKAKYDESKPDFEREYGAEGINAMIKEGRDNGFFVTYNHPTWSLENYPEYSQYRGLNAMEVVNFGCVIVGYDDDNGHCYDDMLRGGERLACIATDDNHNRHPDEDPLCDSYGGYTMIGASALTYEAVAEALQQNLFYSATGDYKDVGPAIRSLAYENGKVTIETSDAKSVAFMTSKRHCRMAHAAQGEVINGAEFELPEGALWFRLTVTDTKGYKAYTRAYFVDELIK